MLVALTFSVVAVKSRAFSSLPCSADGQVCRGWGGTARQRPKLGNGNVPYHGPCAPFRNGGWMGGRDPLFFPRELELFCEFDFFFNSKKWEKRTRTQTCLNIHMNIHMNRSALFSSYCFHEENGASYENETKFKKHTVIKVLGKNSEFTICCCSIKYDYLKPIFKSLQFQFK